MHKIILLLVIALAPATSHAIAKVAIKVAQPTDLPKKQPTPTITVTCTSKDSPYDCLACNTYLEAGFESDYGQRLIAYSVLNRAEMKFRNKAQVCDIVWDRNQYSWTNGTNGRKTVKVIGPKAIAVWERAQKNTRIALYASQRPQRNSFENCITHYYAVYIPVPEWTTNDRNLFRAGQIGQHIFYADNRLNPYSDCAFKSVNAGWSAAGNRYAANNAHVTSLFSMEWAPNGIAAEPEIMDAFYSER